MELILKQDVENLGYKDDLVDVKPGYGRNFLIPAKMAVLATERAKKVLAENLKQRKHKEAKEIENAQKTAQELAKIEMKIFTKAGKGNKLFGSINNANISEELAKLGHHVDRKFIQIQGGTVKATGPYSAQIRLHREVIVNFDFEVIAEAGK